MRRTRLSLAASLLALLALPAVAAPIIVNGGFEQTTLTTKGAFLNNVTGWSGGANLTYLATPGTASSNPLPVYPGLPATSPAGGNFVEADGDPTYSGVISQNVSGLTVGANYQLTFYQAAGQQNGFQGPTTERWQVTFGTQTQLSSKYSLPQGGTGAWESVTMLFSAKAVTQTLSFLAIGTPSGAPPISFLDGVVMTDVPEPASLALLGVGIAGFAAARRRTKR